MEQKYLHILIVHFVEFVGLYLNFYFKLPGYLVKQDYFCLFKIV
jgi:hypothetical protein